MSRMMMPTVRSAGQRETVRTSGGSLLCRSEAVSKQEQELATEGLLPPRNRSCILYLLIHLWLVAMS